MKEGERMRIDAYNQISSYYNISTKKTTSKQAAATDTKDQVSFSTLGRDMQTAKAALTSVPDVREDKVAELKSKIEAGTYNVSGESFADKLLAAYTSM